MANQPGHDNYEDMYAQEPSEAPSYPPRSEAPQYVPQYADPAYSQQQYGTDVPYSQDSFSGQAQYDPRSTEPQAYDPRGTEPQAYDPRATEPPYSQGSTVDVQYTSGTRYDPPYSQDSFTQGQQYRYDDSRQGSFQVPDGGYPQPGRDYQQPDGGYQQPDGGYAQPGYPEDGGYPQDQRLDEPRQESFQQQGSVQGLNASIQRLSINERYPAGPGGYHKGPGGYQEAPGGYNDQQRGYPDPQAEYGGDQALDDLYSQRYVPPEDRQLSFQQGSERQESFRPQGSVQGSYRPPSPRGSIQGSVQGPSDQQLVPVDLAGPEPVPGGGESRWRDPDLPEVIDYLSHPSDAIKANSAGYLQHLCYRNDDVKARTRELGGIPALVELLRSDTPDVHRAAAGALRNLSFGQRNDENKRAIRNSGGIPELRRLLERSLDRGVQELVTGILWNLSSVPELKKPVIEHTLSALTDQVLIPLAGGVDGVANPWSTLVFRNASGVLRNVSSEGVYARQQLRECPGLVDIVLSVLRQAISMNDMDNKAVENCVCLLRNLSYACQEVKDPEYLARRDKPTAAPEDGDIGCFGKKGKKAAAEQKKGAAPTLGYPVMRAPGEPVRGMELLWQPEVLQVYLPLLRESTNPETLEAAAGAVQNLTACDWQPATTIRSEVRDNRQLPIFVELLNLEADRVVAASATALRNLAIDTKNKDLIGKYAIKQLADKLPAPAPSSRVEFPLSDDTVAQIEATINEVIRDRANFAKTLMEHGGCEKLMHVCRSADKDTSRTPIVRYATKVLHTMWGFKELHDDYKRRGWKEGDFIPKSKSKRGVGGQGSRSNTLERNRMGQSGPAVTGYNDRTVRAVERHRAALPADFMQATPQLARAAHSQQPQQEEIPLQQYQGGSTQGLGQYPGGSQSQGINQYGAGPQGLGQYPGGSSQGLNQYPGPPYGGSSQMLAPTQGYAEPINPYDEPSQLMAGYQGNADPGYPGDRGSYQGDGYQGDRSFQGDGGYPGNHGYQGDGDQPYAQLNQSYQEDPYSQQQQAGGYPRDQYPADQHPPQNLYTAEPGGYEPQGSFLGKQFPDDSLHNGVVTYGSDRGSLVGGSQVGGAYGGSQVGGPYGGSQVGGPYGGSQVGGAYDPRSQEPVYATVNKDAKRRVDAAPADDSWV